jgi:hypothetical protein
MSALARSIVRSRKRFCLTRLRGKLPRKKGWPYAAGENRVKGFYLTRLEEVNRSRTFNDQTY